MCERCEDLMVALEAVDANLGTLILARRTLTDRLEKLGTDHSQTTPQAATGAHSAACQHPEDRRVPMKYVELCDACGASKTYASDTWEQSE